MVLSMKGGRQCGMTGYKNVPDERRCIQKKKKC